MGEEGINKILVIRLSSVGDIVLTSPVIRGLKKRFPNSSISILVKEEYKELAWLIPYVNEVLILPKGGIFKFIRLLNQKKFDIVIDLHKNLKSYLIYYLLKATKKIRYKKNVIKRLLLILFSKINFSSLSVIKSYYKCLERLGVTDDGLGPKLIVNKSNPHIKHLLSYNPEAEKILIAISPFARHKPKQWKIDYFAEVADWIANNIGYVVIIGEEVEQKELFNKLNQKRIINLIGKTSLEELVSVISYCKILITNDSGPMHIASALGVRIIAIFGPTTPKFGFAPYGKDNIILEKQLSCRPCSLHGSKPCKYKHYKCLNEIKPKEVISAVKSLLKYN
jgi:lipopolysaccharide heptosyltransferase II